MGNSIGDVMYNAAVIHEAQRQKKKDDEDRAYELQKRKLEQDKYALDLADYQERKAEAQRRREKEDTEWEWKNADRKAVERDRGLTAIRPFVGSAVESAANAMAPAFGAAGLAPGAFSGMAEIGKGLNAQEFTEFYNPAEAKARQEALRKDAERRLRMADDMTTFKEKERFKASLRPLGSRRGGRGSSGGGGATSSGGKYYDTFAKLPSDAKLQFDNAYSEMEALAEKEGRDPPNLSDAREKFRRDFNRRNTAAPAPAPAPRPAGPRGPVDPARNKKALEAMAAIEGFQGDAVGGDVPPDAYPAPQSPANLTLQLRNPASPADSVGALRLGGVSPSVESQARPPSAAPKAGLQTAVVNAGAILGRPMAGNEAFIQQVLDDGEWDGVTPMDKQSLSNLIAEKKVRSGFSSAMEPVDKWANAFSANPVDEPIRNIQAMGDWATRKANTITPYASSFGNWLSRKLTP